MKKLTLTLTAILFAVTGILAQTPSEFKYQAVLRDASGAIMASEAVAVDISILQTTAAGISVFDETHNVTTTAQGLINLNIGSVNDMSGLDFSADIYFVKISVNGTVMGTSQLLSVPYALQAKSAGSIDYANVANTPTLFSGSYTDLSNQPTLFDGVYANLTGKPTLFDGNYSSLTGSPTDVSTFTNDANYLTSFTELDPAVSTNFDFTGAGNGDLLKFDGTKFVKFTPNYLTSYTETDPIFTAWDKSTGISITESQISDFGTYLTSFTEVDGSTTNEIQNLTQVLTESNDGGASQIKNIADPTAAQDAATKAYVDLLEARIYALENPPVIDIDGNSYSTVKIGTQTWMAEDLKVSKYPNGDAIPYIDNDATWAALADDNTSDGYSFYGDSNNDGTVDIANPAYGALYSYAAAIGDNWARDNAANQGVCPTGWHLPSDAEWTELTTFLGGEAAAGGKMKETGTVHWTSPNSGATNESGFSALPGGVRVGSNGVFYDAGSFGYWWSATEYSGANAWVRYLRYIDAEAYRYNNYKSSGFSVRCVRN